MYQNLRIISVILSAIFVTAAFVVGTWLDFSWALICGAFAAVFYCLTLHFKKKQELSENKDEQKPEADFINSSQKENSEKEEASNQKE